MKVNKYKFGFTLAEILITLGIIGIVAAMTLPTLITNIQASQLKSKFKVAASNFSNLIKTMENEGSDWNPDSVQYHENPSSYYKEFMKYVKGATDCGVGSSKKKPCYAGNRWSGDERMKYKQLSGPVADGNLFESGHFIAPNGQTWLFFRHTAPKWNWTLITIDVNGYLGGPNKLGVDLFTWYYNNNDGEWHAGDSRFKCSSKVKDGWNGVGCTTRALQEEDYFKKALRGEIE